MTIKIVAVINKQGSTAINFVPDGTNRSAIERAQEAASLTDRFFAFMGYRTAGEHKNKQTVFAKFASRRDAKHEIRGVQRRLMQFNGINSTLEFQKQ